MAFVHRSPAPRHAPGHRAPGRRAARSPAWMLATVPAVSLGLALLFVSPWLPREALSALRTASAGWVQPTLACAGIAGLVQLALLFGPGRQAPRDVGWRASQVPVALCTGLALWLLMQAPALLALAPGRPPAWQPGWSQGAGVALGPLVAQLAATALVEETVFRGWLWPQLASRLASHLVPRAASLLAAGVSQAVFALLHLPVLLAGDGAVAGTLLVLFATGLVFVGVYAATGNLFVAVVVHALGNAPTLLLAPPPGAPAPTMLLLAGTLAIVAVAAVRRGRARA